VSAVWNALKLLPRKTARLLIRFYQRFISPGLPPSCRFTPSCSAYALTSIERYGLFRGGWLALKRIGRCHPWSPGGYDPVP
jgi:putative membrane protein insertion efficiency factor